MLRGMRESTHWCRARPAGRRRRGSSRCGTRRRWRPQMWSGCWVGTAGTDLDPGWTWRYLVGRLQKEQKKKNVRPIYQRNKSLFFTSRVSILYHIQSSSLQPSHLKETADQIMFQRLHLYRMLPVTHLFFFSSHVAQTGIVKRTRKQERSVWM